tara:strand:+ start:1156 stop:1392 length:237 start_codon:yes stop_codon:yes gene_type:complete
MTTIDSGAVRLLYWYFNDNRINDWDDWHQGKDYVQELKHKLPLLKMYAEKMAELKALGEALESQLDELADEMQLEEEK